MPLVSLVGLSSEARACRCCGSRIAYDGRAANREFLYCAAWVSCRYVGVSADRLRFLTRDNAGFYLQQAEEAGGPSMRDVVLDAEVLEFGRYAPRGPAEGEVLWSPTPGVPPPTGWFEVVGLVDQGDGQMAPP